MNAKQTVLTLSIVALLGASPLQAGWKGQSHAQIGVSGQSAISDVLSDDETDNLVFMREEEKLARDVYRTLYKKFKHPVFFNIATAEQRHMDSIAGMLENYDVPDPVVDDSVGIFTILTLTDLYDESIDLDTKASGALLEAFQTGALIEEIDISDLEDAIAETTRPDLIRLYENLMRGSRNHLRAFVRQIENLGVGYEAQEMDQYDVDVIVDAPLERGGSAQKGRRGR